MKGSAITGPVAKECADLWPRIASNAGSIVWSSYKIGQYIFIHIHFQSFYIISVNNSNIRSTIATLDRLSKHQY